MPQDARARSLHFGVPSIQPLAYRHGGPGQLSPIRAGRSQLQEDYCRTTVTACLYTGGRHYQPHAGSGTEARRQRGHDGILSYESKYCGGVDVDDRIVIVFSVGLGRSCSDG